MRKLAQLVRGVWRLQRSRPLHWSPAEAATRTVGGGGKEGGTLNVSYAGLPDDLDPALSYTREGWTAMYEVYIPLLTYKHANGEAGSEVVPGLAKDLPKISNGGKTYTLILRPGLKYSDGTPVKASDFPFAVERMFELNSGGSPFYTGIVGAEEFAETKKGGIPGIETNDKTGEIVINLTNPRGTFTNELALMFVAPLPAGHADRRPQRRPAARHRPLLDHQCPAGQRLGIRAQPAVGESERESDARRTRPATIDSAKVTIVSNAQSQVNDVEQGSFDWMQNLIPAVRFAEVKDKYEGTQLRVEPTISTYYFWMNTTEPPFDDLKVRQAVNYAVDSDALERIYAGQLKGAQQILPPGMPGYEEFDLYPYDMAKAKQMIKEANPADMDITVWGDTESPNDEAGEYFDGVLQELGFDTTLKILNADNYFTVIGNETTPEPRRRLVGLVPGLPAPERLLPAAAGRRKHPRRPTTATSPRSTTPS